MTWLRDSNTHLNKSEHDNSKSDQERIVMFKPCPFCGDENIRWCCCGPDGCHQITCPNCGNFDFANGVLDGGETFEELRDRMKDKWNTRT